MGKIELNKDDWDTLMRLGVELEKVHESVSCVKLSLLGVTVTSDDDCDVVIVEIENVEEK